MSNKAQKSKKLAIISRFLWICQRKRLTLHPFETKVPSFPPTLNVRQGTGRQKGETMKPSWYIFDEEYDLDNMNNENDRDQHVRGYGSNETSTWYN